MKSQTREPLTDPLTTTHADSTRQLAWAAQADIVLLTVEFLRPPHDANAVIHRRMRAEQISRPSWTMLSNAEVTNLVAMSDLRTEKIPYSDFIGLCKTILIEAQKMTIDAWHDEYWRLFDASLACPINQAAYVRRDKGAIIGDIAGFYRAFGWSAKATTVERPDHLLTQLEFVSVLLAMRANASKSEEQFVVEQALADFARLHMHDWLNSFCQQLASSTSLNYFFLVSQWLGLFWERLSHQHQWRADPIGESHLPDPEPENPYECAANGLVQLGDH